jgi:arginyl-tRNA synthetase
MLLKHLIAQLTTQAVEAAQQQGAIPPGPVPDVDVERPQNPEHGDFAVSLPLRLARTAHMNPMAIAGLLVSLIPADDVISRVWAAAPGFVNFTIDPEWLRQQVGTILQEGDGYGDLQPDSPECVQVEFVSVNPTGPLHVGHARGAVLGSALTNILAAAGHQVSREYYINDAGSQMDVFYRSLYVRYLQANGQEADMPANGYMGDYLVAMAEEVVADEEDNLLQMPEELAVETIGHMGLEKMLDLIRRELDAVQVTFDVWFSEKSLYDTGEYDETIALLEKQGHLIRREGATWFASTALGEDKDNVLVRTSGEPTYFASDIAYHRNKFIVRGFDRVINIWGADHQGHVSRLKAAVSALSIDPARLTIVISQLVTLRSGDVAVRASKRSGVMVTLKELVDEVGSDACRYFFLSRSPESQMEFDLDLAKSQSTDNPVYYIQYAHARIAALLREAGEQGVDHSQGDLALLTHEAEEALIKKMLLLPELIESMAETLEVHHLPHYAVELATAFHRFYEKCRVFSSQPDDKAMTLARLKLVEACCTVLARCLSLMSMSAPERM